MTPFISFCWNVLDLYFDFCTLLAMVAQTIRMSVPRITTIMATPQPIATPTLIWNGSSIVAGPSLTTGVSE